LVQKFRPFVTLDATNGGFIFGSAAGLSYNKGMKMMTCLWISLIGLTSLGSCATYHTPLSRSIVQESLNTPDFRTTDSTTMAADAKKIQFADKTDLFDWPVDDARMTRGYLPAKRRPHLGIDLASKKNTPILASQGGTVIYAGREFRGYGRMIMIESGNGWATLYAHMEKILVQEGEKVSQGQIVGAMGRSGRATGVHLHFEIRKDRGPIDPLPLLPNGSRVAHYLKDRRGSSN
jgi:murein DD-endopeptidase MepM/ murein hydrolase activator NlpD